MSGLYLVAAIATETTGTLSLKLASDGRGLRWYGLVMAGYLGAFALLTLALKEGLALGVAYGIWSAGGVAVTAIASRFLFGEPLTRTMVAGIALIMAGVLLGRPYEPRNHAVFFRQYGSAPSLCIRCGHDRLVPVPRGPAERPS